MRGECVCLVGFVFGAGAADILGAGAGAYKVCLADFSHAQPYRYSDVLQMHTDQGVADIHAGMGTDGLHGNRRFKVFPYGGGKGTAGVGMRYDGDRLPAVALGGGSLNDQSAVEMLTALRGKINAALAPQRQQPVYNGFCGFKAAVFTDVLADDLAGRAAYHKYIAGPQSGNLQQFVGGAADLLGDLFFIHVNSPVYRIMFFVKCGVWGTEAE